MAKVQNKVVIPVATLHKPYVGMLESVHARVRAARGRLSPIDEAYLAQAYAPKSVPELTAFLESMGSRGRLDFQRAVLGEK